MTPDNHVPYLHRNHVAFYVRSSVVEKTLMSMSDFTLLDGSHPRPGQPSTCGTCGASVDVTTIPSPRGRSEVHLAEA